MCGQFAVPACKEPPIECGIAFAGLTLVLSPVPVHADVTLTSGEGTETVSCDGDACATFVVSQTAYGNAHVHLVPTGYQTVDFDLTLTDGCNPAVVKAVSLKAS